MIKILVPVNFSDHSLNALTYALRMAENFKSEVTILYCCSDYISRDKNQDEQTEVSISDKEIETIEEKMREKLRQLTAQVIDETKDFVDLHIQYRFEIGYPEDVIPKISSSMKSEIIVMGTSNKEGAIKQSMGSITGDVVSKAKAPVLAVPPQSIMENQKIGNVLFLMELEERDFFSLHRLVRLISPFQTHLFAVYHQDSKKMEKIDEERIEKLKIYCKNIYRNQSIDFQTLKGGEFTESIKNFIEENKIDLIAMTRRRRTLLRQLFSPSVTKKMLYKTKIPLLIFHS